MTKLEKFRKGLPLVCKHHGEHSKWSEHSGNNVKCNLCASQHQKNARNKDPLKFLLKDAQQHSKAKNRDFTITLADVLDCLVRQDNRCALSGIHFTEDRKPSLDRIDSNCGYTPNNIQLVLKEVNIMKSNFKQDDFIELCVAITVFRGR